MKSLLILCISIILFSCNRNLNEIEISIPTVQCGMCAITIEDAVKKIDGVKKVAVDITALIANVSFNADKTTIHEIERAISRVGYQANMIVAVNEAYKNLPLCCKLPEDR